MQDTQIAPEGNTCPLTAVKPSWETVLSVEKICFVFCRSAGVTNGISPFQKVSFFVDGVYPVTIFPKSPMGIFCQYFIIHHPVDH